MLLFILLFFGTALLSFVINLVTIVVLARAHTTVLWKFLLNLSLADILSTACIPIFFTEFLTERWIFPSVMCHFIYMVQFCSTMASTWTVATIGIERYIAIVYPLENLRFVKQHEFTIIAAIWLASVAITSPHYFSSRIVEFTFNATQYYECANDLTRLGTLYIVTMFACMFFVPISIIIGVYGAICVRLLRYDRLPLSPPPPQLPPSLDQSALSRVRVKLGRRRRGRNDHHNELNKKFKAIKMLLMIVILFVVCWLPINVLQIMLELNYDYTTLNITGHTVAVVFILANWLRMAHSLINPLVYCFMSGKFRKNLHLAMFGSMKPMLCWHKTF